MTGAQITLFRNNGRRPLAKAFSLENGRIVSEVAAQMSAGTFERLDFASIDDYSDYLLSGECGTDCAVAYGVNDKLFGHIAALEIIRAGRARAGAIPRNADHFAYRKQKPGILFLDIDPLPGDEFKDAFHYDRIFREFVPWWAATRRFYIPSSSSEIYDAAGRLVSRKSAYHCHLMIDDASQAKAITDAIFTALVDAGHGRVVISKSGARLLRTIIDRAVPQGERLDFAFGGHLGKGLKQERFTTPMGLGHPMLKTAGLGREDFGAWRASSPVVRKLMAEAEPEAKRIEKAWVEDRVEDAVMRGADREKARREYGRAASHGELPADLRLFRRDGTSLTVGELLADPARHDRTTFCEPLEPDYAGGAEVAIAYLVGQNKGPAIHSQGHGGRTYFLPPTQSGSAEAQPRLRAVPAPAPETTPMTDGNAALKIEAGEGESAEQKLVEAFPIAPEYSEEGLALAFAEQYKSTIRYVAGWVTWMHFDTRRWQRERTLLIYDKIRTHCRKAAATVPTDKWQLKNDLNKASTRGAVEKLCRSDRRFAAHTDQWDADDWVLNTPAGIIDLTTGENLGYDPTRYATKTTSVAPEGDCPLWLKFLDQVTGDDEELRAYLKRMCGYLLTGSTREQAMFFAYGTGGNGKGTFFGTLGKIMGDYLVESPAETFAERKQDRHPTELARLDGARFVLSQETEQGQYWAEARIKALTGGDVITARFMRGDFFEFRPKFKLCIAGNHKPQLRSVDAAIRRRFNMIPFNVSIPKAEQDQRLGEKLEEEAGGILHWMIEGCLEWQEHGLNPPQSVLAATADYLESEDSLGQWIETCCVTGDQYTSASLASLFQAWKRYADANKLDAGNDKALSASLEGRSGLSKKKTGKGVLFLGIRPKSLEEQRLDDGSDEYGG